LSENNASQQNPEDFSGTKLLEFVREVSGYADKEISRVSLIYKVAAFWISVIIAVGITFTFKDAADMRNFAQQQMSEQKKSMQEGVERQEKQMVDQRNLMKEEIERQQKLMRDTQETLFSKMKVNLSQQVVNLGQAVNKKVDEQFDKENITNLVTDKAQIRIDTIADPIITKKISKEIQPKINEAEKRIQLVKTELNTTRENIEKLNRTADYLSIVSLAQNDDKAAFEQLQKWAKDKTYPLQERAVRDLSAIMDNLDTGYLVVSSPPIAWGPGIDPSKLTIIDLEAKYESVSSANTRSDIAHYIGNRSDISKKDKLQFFVKMLQKEKSIRAYESMLGLFEKYSGQKFNRSDTKSIVEWWNQNKMKIR